MSLVGNTMPLRLQRLTSFSIVTAFLRAVIGCWSDKKDLLIPDDWLLAELNDFRGHYRAARDFENRDRARNIDQIARQGRTAGIHHQGCAVPNYAFDMAVALHDHI